MIPELKPYDGKIYSQFGENKPIVRGCPTDDETITEQNGYIPLEVQVEAFQRAGMNLEEYRKQLFQNAYDFETDEEAINSNYEDPSRDIGMSDIGIAGDAMTKAATIRRRYKAYLDSIRPEEKSRLDENGKLVNVNKPVEKPVE